VVETIVTVRTDRTKNLRLFMALSSLSPHLVQVGAGARREGLGARVEVGEGVGGESLRSTPYGGEPHCKDPGYNFHLVRCEM